LANVKAIRFGNSDEEPEVIDYYITDFEGNKKLEYEFGDEM